MPGSSVEPLSIRITELMPNADASATDWVELYNPTDAAIDLEGCSLTDDGTDRVTFSDSLTVEPGGYVVIASSRETGENMPAALVEPHYLFTATEFELTAPGGDQVILTCGDRVIDRVDYAEYNPGPATGTRGWQIGIDARLDTDEPVWCYTPLPVLDENFVYDGTSVASPGVENPACNIFPFVYYNQSEVLLEGIDLDATLRIAEAELAKGGGASVLVIWAIRDQRVNVQEAQRISALYFDHIEGIYGSDRPDSPYDWNFGVWHFAWAISNLYRNAETDDVRTALQSAYDDALARPSTVQRFQLVAIDHVQGNRILMGDIHSLGRDFAVSHIVVPGNPTYLQSFDDYANATE